MSALEWLDDMLDCLQGEHGPHWAERAEKAAVDAANGLTKGTWWEWRDIRQSESYPEAAS